MNQSDQGLAQLSTFIKQNQRKLVFKAQKLFRNDEEWINFS
jgi:hypothetical protein